jgi:hypothetical protein
MSGDGRYVAFFSQATNFGVPNAGSVNRIFVRDLQGTTTTLVSRAAGAGGAAADDSSSDPDVSAGGRYVAFDSEANNLSTADNDTYANVFVRDVLGAPAAAAADTVAPGLSSLSLKNKRFRVAKTATAVIARSKARKRRRKAAPKGTAFRYRLSETATVTIKIERATTGLKLKRKGRRRASCVSATRSNKRKVRKQLLAGRAIKRLHGRARARALRRATKRRRCTLYKRAGTLTRKGRGPGSVSTAFSGRIGRKALRTGSYRASVQAADAAGNKSPTRRVRFRVVKR